MGMKRGVRRRVNEGAGEEGIKGVGEVNERAGEEEGMSGEESE